MAGRMTRQEQGDDISVAEDVVVADHGSKPAPGSAPCGERIVLLAGSRVEVGLPNQQRLVHEVRQLPDMIAMVVADCYQVNVGGVQTELGQLFSDGLVH